MNNDQYVCACVGSSKFSQHICNYGIDLANILNLPLHLLNTKENDSSKTITQNRALLDELEQKAKEKKVKKITVVQNEGMLYRNLLENQKDIRITVLGLNDTNNEKKSNSIGSQVEKIIKDIRTPILLVNGNYKPIRKVLIAYDGSLSSQKALDMLIMHPIFKDVQRDIISVNNETILQEAKEKLANSNINANFIYLEGEPVSAILSYQKVCDIDLISMGAFGHGMLHHIIYGSVTHHMLLEACVPLLLIR